MPEGINLKHPSNYGVRTLRQIMSAKDNIVFQFEDRNSSSTIARSTVAPMGLGVATTSTAEVTSSATTNSSPLVSASQSSSTSSSSSVTVFPSSANIISPSASETVFPTAAFTIIPSASETVLHSSITMISPSPSETVFPTSASTISRSASETVFPTSASTIPTSASTICPSASETVIPTSASTIPTSASTISPSASETVIPTSASTIPTSASTISPSASETVFSTSASTIPTSASTICPSASETVIPTQSVSTISPSASETVLPSSVTMLSPSASTTIEEGKGRKRKRTTRQTRRDQKQTKDHNTERCQAYLCQQPNADKKQTLHWIQCDDCEKWFHFECVGIQVAPPGRYVCGCSVEYFNKSNYPSRMSLLSPDISSVKDHVKNILYANTASKRHTLFNSNKKADLLHLSCNICSLFSPSMIRRFTLEVQSFLPEFWPEFNDRNTRMASYVLSVLIPEATVYVMTIREGCSRHSVERLLGTLENEINTQEEETDEDD
ncbi:PREDICTED: mucin-5AC-like [Acropora digitifera]|uniref:mucin-5AC-like n=1 Tax=Acropora digitifera TaxID=70779 RepID=UPI00077A2FDE|nr:PREDICTED: mucin-5AC-like [Acropora digitifera]